MYAELLSRLAILASRPAFLDGLAQRCDTDACACSAEVRKRCERRRARLAKAVSS